MRPEADFGLHEHPGPELAVRIGQRRLHLDISGRLVYERIDRRHPAAPLDAGEIVSGYLHHSPDGDLSQRLLRHAEVHVDRTGRLKRDERIAGGEILSEIDLTDPQRAGEWRPDRLALDHRLDFADLGAGLARIGGRAIELGARDDAFVEQPLQPIGCHPRILPLSLRRSQLCPLLLSIEYRQ